MARRNGTPAVVPSTPPGADERLAFDADVLGEELVGAAGRRRHRRDEKLGTRRSSKAHQRAAAPRRRRFGRQAPGAARRRRHADLGPADAGLGEAHLARNSGVSAISALTRSARSGGASAHRRVEPLDPDARRGQKPQLDAVLRFSTGVPAAWTGQARCARDARSQSMKGGTTSAAVSSAIKRRMTVRRSGCRPTRLRLPLRCVLIVVKRITCRPNR